MKDDPAVPKFIKPGDNPELDRILAELKAEPPPVGYGIDLFGRRYRRPGSAAAGKPAEAKAAEARPAMDAAAAGKAWRRRGWIALGAVAIVVPIVMIALGRSRGPQVVVVGPAPVSMSNAPTGARAVVVAPVVAPSAPEVASAASSASAVPVPRPSTTGKKRAPHQAADAGAAPGPVSSDFLE